VGAYYLYNLTMKTKIIRIGGMSCVNCQNKIEKALRKTAGIVSAKVSFARGTAKLNYAPDVVSFDKIEDIINALGYEVEGTGQGKRGKAGAKPAAKSGAIASTPARAAALLLIIVAATLIFNYFGVSLYNAFPAAEEDMSLAMVFLIGLITSVHCIAMCGGINLSQTLGVGSCELGVGEASNGESGVLGAAAPRRGGALLPTLLYNLGRVISYTVIGALVGAIGSVFTLSGYMRGIVQLVAGVFMVVIGFNMLGIFPVLRRLAPRLPRGLQAKLDSARARNSSPLVVGLLNGLMPCGPLQAMQIYALSTESAVQGALSMLLFALGTVPLMFALGAFASFMSGKFARRAITVGACVIAVMGLTMFHQGWALSGLSFDALLPPSGSVSSAPSDSVSSTPADSVSSAPAGVGSTGAVSNTGDVGGKTGGAEGKAGVGRTGSPAVKIVNGAQVVSSVLAGGRYPAITVREGMPVRWIINAPAGSINGCNYKMIIPEYNIEYTFKPGENVIEFTPKKAGKFIYCCWMGMIRSIITVVPGD